MRFLFDQRTRMRDGIELSTDVYLPTAVGPAPTILLRTPYDNAKGQLVETAQWFARRGYAFALQDVRGRGDSDGRLSPFRGEGPDGADTIEWIARQDWSTGRIGMMGGSYASSVQWWAAHERPKHLTTIVSTATSGRWVQEPSTKGKLRPSQFLWLHAVAGHTMQFDDIRQGESPAVPWDEILRHRPYREIDYALGRTNTAWSEWMAHRDDLDYWRAESQYRDYEQLDLPVLHITGWYDGSVVGSIEMFDEMRAKSPASEHQHLLVGPWDHSGTRTPRQHLGPHDFGPTSVIDINLVHLQWFDRWLKEDASASADLPRVKYFVMGAGEWANAESWPPPGVTMVTFHMESDGSAVSRMGNGRLTPSAPIGAPFDAYTYDPDEPTPSQPVGSDMRWGAAPLDQHDHTFAENRKDVLVYTSEPLNEVITLLGAPVIELYASSDAPDTDFAAILSILQSNDERSLVIAEGLVRTSFSGVAAVISDQPTMYRIELNDTAIRLAAGTRLRLSIQSAEFPAYDRNPNTGALIGDDEEIAVAHQRVYHTEALRSKVLLPVMTTE